MSRRRMPTVGQLQQPPWNLTRERAAATRRMYDAFPQRQWERRPEQLLARLARLQQMYCPGPCPRREALVGRPVEEPDVPPADQLDIVRDPEPREVRVKGGGR